MVIQLTLRSGGVHVAIQIFAFLFTPQVNGPDSDRRVTPNTTMVLWSDSSSDVQ